jgi:hypothetical protein
MGDSKILMGLIENEDTLPTAKHRYAEVLIERFNNIKVRDYLQSKFNETGDYFYMGLLKNYKL